MKDDRSKNIINYSTMLTLRCTWKDSRDKIRPRLHLSAHCPLISVIGGCTIVIMDLTIECSVGKLLERSVEADHQILLTVWSAQPAGV